MERDVYGAVITAVKVIRSPRYKERRCSIGMPFWSYDTRLSRNIGVRLSTVSSADSRESGSAVSMVSTVRSKWIPRLRISA